MSETKWFHLTSVLELSPIELVDWLYPVAVGIGVFIIIEIEKVITHKVFKRK